MKKFISLLIAVALAALGVVTIASPASAHVGSVNGTAYCNQDGTWGVTWTFTASDVPSGRQAEVKAMTTSAGTLNKAPGSGVMAGSQVMLSAWAEHAANWPGVPQHTGNWSEQFSTVGVPANVNSVSTMVQYDFKDGPSGDPTKTVSKPDNCDQPDTSDQSITFCHAVQGNGETGYGFNLITTNVHAFYQAGHVDHEGDIYPAGSYTKNGDTFSWPAQGNTALIATNCGTPPPDEFEPYEVEACWTMENSDGVEGTYEFPQTYGCDTEPACEELVEYQYDTYWIRDEADEALFEQLKQDGLESPADDNPLEPHDYYSEVVHGDEECPPDVVTVVPGAPVVKDLCGTADDHYGLPSGPAGVVYSRDGLNLIATITAANTVWGTLPAGWVDQGGGVAKYTFNPQQFTDQPCTEQPNPKTHTESHSGCDMSQYGAGFGAGTVNRSGTENYVYQNGEWVLSGVINWGPWTFTAFTGDQLRDCTIKPDIRIEYSNWVDGSWGCGDTTVTQTRTKTVTEYVWNGITWVAGVPVVTVENQIRNLTEAEQFPCPIPVKYEAPAAPTPPTCDTSGSFTLPTDTEFIDWDITPAFNGPGVYTVTATLIGDLPVWADGFEGATRSLEIEVLGPLGYQDNDPEAECYVSHLPEQDFASDSRESCRLGGVETTNTVSTTTYEFVEETQSWVPTTTAASSLFFDPYSQAELEKKGCVKTPEPPEEPTPPNPPTEINAGLSGDDGGSNSGLPGGLGVVIAGLALVIVAARKRTTA